MLAMESGTEDENKRNTVNTKNFLGRGIWRGFQFSETYTNHQGSDNMNESLKNMIKGVEPREQGARSSKEIEILIGLLLYYLHIIFELFVPHRTQVSACSCTSFCYCPHRRKEQKSYHTCPILHSLSKMSW